MSGRYQGTDFQAKIASTRQVEGLTHEVALAMRDDPLGGMAQDVAILLDPYGEYPARSADGSRVLTLNL